MKNGRGPVFRAGAFALALCLLLPASAVAAEDAGSQARKLAGTNGRRWTFERFEVFMGDEDTCLEGEDYTFYRDHTVLIRRCEKGRISEVRKAWRAHAASDLDMMLQIGADVYILLFFQDRSASGRECMILRKRATLKTDKSTDKILCRMTE